MALSRCLRLPQPSVPSMLRFLLLLVGLVAVVLYSSNLHVVHQEAATLAAFQDSIGILPVTVGQSHNQTADFDVRKPELAATTQRRTALRFDWENLEIKSELAKRMVQHQSNCSLPLGNFGYRNRFGLGSDLHVWGQALCNGVEQNIRIRTRYPWTWLDEGSCDLQQANHSSMLCYFPKSELQCNQDVSTVIGGNIAHWLSHPKRNSVRIACDSIVKEYDIPQIRAAGIEYLFHRVSPLLVTEAERQVSLVFPNGVIPKQLITVHVRWGDKKREMKLVTIEEYIAGVQQILDKRADKHGNDTTPVSIYLASEDPKAVAEFKVKAPPHWNIYVDQYFVEMLEFRNSSDIYNQGPRTSKLTKGRAGLVSLGSLLVAMEANDFVLTTASNWSRLMNELRKAILDAACNNCTSMVDLRYGEW